MMTIRVSLTHRTSYQYDKKIDLGPQTIRLRPAPHTRTPIVSYSQKIQPASHYLNWQQDPFGNYQARAVFPDPTDHFSVEIGIVADMIAINPFDFFLDEEAFHVPFLYDANTKAELQPYLATHVSGEMYNRVAAQTVKLWHSGDKSDFRTIDFLVELNQALQKQIKYIVRMEPGVQTPEETLKRGEGSCRDSAWLLVNLLRHVGIAARFVSGYLVQLAPDEIPVDGPKGPEEDFTDLHAWAEAFVPGAGWIGLDATSGLFAGEGHIPLAATPNPSSAAPISGSLDPCEVSFDFEMSVTRLVEPARITKPFTALQWGALDKAGQAVDTLLEARDVRLTQGGEPTFVASDDRDAEEWTIDATGPTKQAYADKLARRLRDRFAKGGVITHGQGKWYPGEPLPRWAYSVIWRRDGVPLWNSPHLIADTESETAAVESATRFSQALTETLGLEKSFVQPLYEDPAEHLLKEANLAINVTAQDNKLDDPVERTQLARVFERGLGEPVGFVLPLQEAQADATAGRSVKWMSEIWRTRRDKLFLLRGESPAGFRLPMKALPYVPEAEYPMIQAVDPFTSLPALPIVNIQKQKDEGAPVPRETSEASNQSVTVTDGGNADHSGDNDDGPPPVRTALVIEPRRGFLSIFLPPTETGEAYIDLIAAVEQTALELGQPIRLEGYPPPKDSRFDEIKVTPDPGVIEVNIHPSASWDDLRDKTEALYEDAKAIGLDASGFMIDGRPTGSGGGAHVTLGGATAPESPFLRRPDVLGSIIRFWQNHPSLSYFFAGMFIGPTSQAPRMDEARSDLLYEVELALSQLPKANDKDFPPWLVDRILRHLLVDVTGNTHRAEICIDKLYSPDGPAGRLGLVEFRAFEMPPHWQMNVAQQLLLRALVAWCWETPYTHPLISHGTALHDQFMLPEAIWTDFKSALGKISTGVGVGIDPEWFRAQFDFRFPAAGRKELDGAVLELRHALEPWHVLGEEGAATGTTRFVDSSLERLQVKLIIPRSDRRLAVFCNGRRIPMHAADTAGEQIGGVRFRAWLPSSCLHPQIKPHGPLVFDIVDEDIGASLGGCTYHPEHPGGRNFKTRPVNALEAEGRRLSRFFDHGHTSGAFEEVIPKTTIPKTPWTLDLRVV